MYDVSPLNNSTCYPHSGSWGGSGAALWTVQICLVCLLFTMLSEMNRSAEKTSYVRSEYRSKSTASVYCIILWKFFSRMFLLSSIALRNALQILKYGAPIIFFAAFRLIQAWKRQDTAGSSRGHNINLDIKTFSSIQWDRGCMDRIPVCMDLAHSESGRFPNFITF